MPVEIREISINFTLLEENTQDSSGKEVENTINLSEDVQNKMVKECVRSVLRILRDKNEL